MASFLNADLPSEDEEDESFDPDTEEAAKAPKKKKKQETTRRGVKLGAGETANDAVEQAKAAKRKANAASKFQELLQKSHKIHSKGVTKHTAPAPTPARVAPGTTGSLPTRPIVTNKRPRHDPDAYWLQALGFVKQPKIEATDSLVARILSAATHEPICTEVLEPLPVPINTVDSAVLPASLEYTEPATVAADASAPAADTVMADAQDTADAANEDSEAAARAASAALLNIAAGLHSADGAKKASMVKVVETRNFAGQEIEVTTEHQAGSKAAESAQHRASAAASKSGLDAALANITGPKKANTIDKSADDWKGFKAQNADVKDELNEYNKSSDKYLEKQAFLQKAEYTEYAKSRDERLASDIRTRGRT